MSNKLSNLVLTGFMGTGKSAVGKTAASKLGFDFIDIDNEIEKRTNMTIPYIFESFGEEHFREIEYETVKEISLKTKMVISTGGGVVINPENINNLRTKGFIVLLKARPDIIFRNVSKDKSRPLLKCENPMAKICELLEKRKENYKNNDFEIDVSELNVEEAAQKAVEIFRSNCSI